MGYLLTLVVALAVVGLSLSGQSLVKPGQRLVKAWSKAVGKLSNTISGVATVKGVVSDASHDTRLQNQAGSGRFLLGRAALIVLHAVTTLDCSLRGRYALPGFVSRVPSQTVLLTSRAWGLGSACGQPAHTRGQNLHMTYRSSFSAPWSSKPADIFSLLSPSCQPPASTDLSELPRRPVTHAPAAHADHIFALPRHHFHTQEVTQRPTAAPSRSPVTPRRLPSSKFCMTPDGCFWGPPAVAGGCSCSCIMDFLVSWVCSARARHTVGGAGGICDWVGPGCKPSLQSTHCTAASC